MNQEPRALGLLCCPSCSEEGWENAGSFWFFLGKQNRAQQSWFVCCLTGMMFWFVCCLAGMMFCSDAWSSEREAFLWTVLTAVVLPAQRAQWTLSCHKQQGFPGSPLCLAAGPRHTFSRNGAWPVEIKGMRDRLSRAAPVPPSCTVS